MFADIPGFFPACYSIFTPSSSTLSNFSFSPSQFHSCLFPTGNTPYVPLWYSHSLIPVSVQFSWVQFVGRGYEKETIWQSTMNSQILSCICLIIFFFFFCCCLIALLRQIKVVCLKIEPCVGALLCVHVCVCLCVILRLRWKSTNGSGV